MTTRRALASALVLIAFALAGAWRVASTALRQPAAARPADESRPAAAGVAPPSNSAQSTPPRRIVCLVPAATEMLFAMGAGGQLAGVSSYDAYPPEVIRLPRLGGLLDPDVERILSLKPDLAIIYATQIELAGQLDRSGVPSFLYGHGDLEDVIRTMRSLGLRVGAAANADAAADRMQSRLSMIRTRVAGRKRPRTLLVIERERGSLRGVLASGGYGFLHDLLEAAGGQDVAADITRESIDVSTEMLLARAPEAIIELHYRDDLTPEQIEAERRVWDRLPTMPAVKNHRVYLLAGDEFVVPGPRVIDAAQRLSRALHPDAW